MKLDNFAFKSSSGLAPCFWQALSLIAILLSLQLPASAGSNQIQAENRNAGTTAWQLSNPASNREIEGYASATSVNAGQQISFFVNTSDPSYTLTIYRIGWYNGTGGRQMSSPVTLSGIAQAMPAADPTTGMIECQWINPYTINIPSSWTTGFYLVKLTGTASGKQAYIIFVVRDDGYPSALLFQSAVTTYQAYNAWGGKSLYAYNSIDAATSRKVSFNRPYDDSYGAGEFLEWELNMVAFLEQQGYDVSYATSIDTHESPFQLLIHQGFLSVGHDEYWSWEMRENVTNARDAGVNLGWFSANDVYWQIRFEPSPVTGAADRTIVGYKDYWPEDPDAANSSTYYLVTTQWAEPHVTLPGISEDSLIGPMYNGAEPLNTDIVVSNPTHWVFAGSGVANGTHLKGLAGYEADAVDAGSPSGIVTLAHSPYVLNGTTYYSDMTIYTAGSGATVFATGSNQWSYGLSNLSPWSPSPSLVSGAAQQITNNVLNRFIGANPPSPRPTPTAPPPTPMPVPTASSSSGPQSSGVSLRGYAYSYGDDGTGLVLQVPNGVQANDVMLAQVTAVGSFPIALSAPNGWSLLHANSSADASQIQAIYLRIAGTKEPPAYFWLTTDNSQGAVDVSATGGIAALYNVSNESPVAGVTGQYQAASNSVSAPALTGTISQEHAVFFMSSFFGATSGTAWTIPSGMVKRWFVTDASQDDASVMADEALNSTGSIGPFVATLNNSVSNAGTVVVLAPASAAATPSAASSATSSLVPIPTATSSETPSTASPKPTATTPAPTASTILTRTPTATPSSTGTPSPAPSGSPGLIGVRGAATGSLRSGTSFTLVSPAGTIANDTLLAQVSAINYNAAKIALTPPTGWNLIRADSSAAGDQIQALYVRIAGAGEPTSYTWTTGSSVAASGGIIAYYNVNTSQPVDAQAGQYNAASNTITCPSITASEANDRLATFMTSFLGEGNGDWTLPAGMTTQWLELNSGYELTAVLVDAPLSSAGASGVKVADIVSASSSGAMVALRPATTGSPAPAPSPTGGPTASPAPSPSPPVTPTAVPTHAPSSTITSTSTRSSTPTLTITPSVTITRSATPGPTSTAPVVTIVSPANGAVVAGSVTVSVQVSSAVQWVNLSVDGDYLASSPPYTFSWQSSATANGTHVLTVDAFAPPRVQIGSVSITLNVKN